MSIYTETARFDTGRALTETEMRRSVPSIFAVTGHESRSERFQPIPTIEVLRGLIREGFMPVGAKQSRSRTEGKADFTKHLIRLRRIDDGKVYNVGDTVCEILLKNANDGSSAYELMAGLFRIRCLNSLVAQTGTIDAIKVRHSGDVAGRVIEGTYRVLGEAERTLAAPQDWSTLRLNRKRGTFLRTLPMFFGLATAKARRRRRSSRNSCLFRAVMTTVLTISGRSGTWCRKMPSRAACAAWDATTSAGRAA